MFILMYFFRCVLGLTLTIRQTESQDIKPFAFKPVHFSTTEIKTIIYKRKSIMSESIVFFIYRPLYEIKYIANGVRLNGERFDNNYNRPFQRQWINLKQMKCSPGLCLS